MQRGTKVTAVQFKGTLPAGAIAPQPLAEHMLRCCRFVDESMMSHRNSRKNIISRGYSWASKLFTCVVLPICTWIYSGPSWATVLKGLPELKE